MMLQDASLEAALDLLLAAAVPMEHSNNVFLSQALGMVCAGDIRTTVDNPPFDRSPLDGVAFRSQDTQEAAKDRPVRLRIVGTLYAGSVYDKILESGEALRIMTGAAMPRGSDCMSPKEAVKEEGDEVLIFRPAARHENYIFRGEDIKCGEIFIEQGTELNFAHLGMLAADGQESVKVYRLPVIGTVCVGDEFSPANAPLEPGKIYNSNGLMLDARLREYGLSSLDNLIVPDDPQTAANIIDGFLDSLDVLLTSGSVSVGDKDIMGQVYDILGVDTQVSKLSFKPGTSFLCGRYRDKQIFSLSGNPFAALATMELVARPFLAKMSRKEKLFPSRFQALLNTPFPGGKNRNMRRFLRGRLTHNPEGGLPVVTLPEGQSSGRLFSLSGCNCLVDLKADRPTLSSGTTVEVLSLDFKTTRQGPIFKPLGLG
jgi:molybdopterin molybdotransferase